MRRIKRNRLIPFVVLSVLLTTACDDNKMEWEEIDSDRRITEAEIPLKLAEKISRYEALNTYSDLNLSVGIGLTQYMENETYAALTNENFDEVVVGYAMKHGAMVKSNGEPDFNAVDAFTEKVKAAGLSIYGHTLVWHKNQNASYLNGLIAHEVIPAPAGESVLDISGLEDGSFTGWQRLNPGDGIEIANGEGVASGDNAVRMTASASSSNYWDLQLQTPEIVVDSSHTYEVSFFIRSDQPGSGRISFSGLANGYPWKDWYGTGGDWTESFETTSTYQQIKFTVDDFTDTKFVMNFDMGKIPGVTYYIDINTLSVTDLDAETTVVNMFSNGDFESGTLDPWGGWGNSSTREVSAQGEGHESDYCMVLTNPTAAQYYEAQQLYTFDDFLVEGTEYFVSFWVKADVACEIQFQIQNADYGGDNSEAIPVTTQWSYVERTITASTADKNKFLFDFGTHAATFYIDDVVFGIAPEPELKSAQDGPTYIEKTDEEKTQLIGDAMESWIAAMVGHFKNDIKAWDVVNEPMNENGTVRDGNVNSELASDEFYWQKYLGKDYAVTAFKLARQYGNADDKLFINDYNLEYSLDKCRGIIEYVEYIESQGAQVDGIGTQMHISINSDTTRIIEMFNLLAASGKLIKVSELDVKVETNAPSTEQFQQQSDMYQFVIEKYLEIIPEAQQYGITIWGISDHPDEHEFWLPDDAPNIWDADYQRKIAYKGVADALAGRDVSEDFTGELQF